MQTQLLNLKEKASRENTGGVYASTSTNKPTKVQNKRLHAYENTPQKHDVCQDHYRRCAQAKPYVVGRKKTPPASGTLLFPFKRPQSISSPTLFLSYTEDSRAQHK